MVHIQCANAEMRLHKHVILADTNVSQVITPQLYNIGHV